MSNQSSKKPKDEINENLLGCHHEYSTCCFGSWCTPCLFGENVKRTSHTNYISMCCLYAVLSACCLCCIPHRIERRDLRRKYKLKEDRCGDLPTVVCCSPCALCQEAREINWRERENGNAAKVSSNTPVILQPRGLAPSPGKPRQNTTKL